MMELVENAKNIDIVLLARKILDPIRKEIPEKQRDALEEMRKEYEVAVEKYIKPVVEQGVENIAVLIYPFSEWRLEYGRKMLDISREIKSLGFGLMNEGIFPIFTPEEKLLVVRYAQIEKFWPSAASKKVKAPKISITEIIFCENICVFLLNCLMYCVENSVYSEVRTDITRLLSEKITMYEKLLEQPKKHLELITQLEKYFQIENVDDVVELYEKNNEAFDGLPLYHEKIQEIYGDTPVKLTISHDPLMPEADIVLHIEKKSATLKEWSEKNLQLVQWTTRNETWQKRDKKNHVIAMNDIEGDCTEEFFKEFGCGV